MGCKILGGTMFEVWSDVWIENVGQESDETCIELSSVTFCGRSGRLRQMQTSIEVEGRRDVR